MGDKTMKVKACKGELCPHETRPRDYIPDDKFVEVPRNTYYTRLVGDGSLIEETAKKADDAAGKKGG